MGRAFYAAAALYGFVLLGLRGLAFVLRPLFGQPLPIELLVAALATGALATSPRTGTYVAGTTGRGRRVRVWSYRVRRREGWSPFLTDEAVLGIFALSFLLLSLSFLVEQQIAFAIVAALSVVALGAASVNWITTRLRKPDSPRNRDGSGGPSA